MASTNLTPYIRAKDLTYLAQCIANNACCAVVGISNMGKSHLLRQIREPEILLDFPVEADVDTLGFIYIDFNLQLQMTQQAFYELVLRSIITQLKALNTEASLLGEVEEAYKQVVAPTDDFQNALSFNQAIIALCEKWSRRLILMFDEFDEVYLGLDKRVFLNLRALRDKYPKKLSYIVMVGDPLAESREDTEAGEFAELFAHNTHYLNPLNKEDTAQYIKSFMQANNVRFSKKDREFIASQSGGHPGLLEEVCQVMAKDTVEGVTLRDTRVVLSHLADSRNVRNECFKLWNGLNEMKQEALSTFTATNKMEPSLQKRLIQRGILTKNNQGNLAIFGELFANFVHRQHLIMEEPEHGVILDIEGGQVYVDGKQTDTLTKLEYRLLMLFYGHIDKICDKYRIVESVWGEDYIEEVDDARIEKLVSRLRQKIEPNPSEPKYLITIRGRGYRLQSHSAT